MPEKEPDLKHVTHSETPDEIIPVEDYGAKITVEIWHSTTPPTLRTTFNYENSTDPNKISDFQDKPETKHWIKDAQYYTLYRKAYLAGLGAISLHQGNQNESVVE